MVPSPVAARAARPVGDIVARLREDGPAAVALSGGVDSGLVAALAHEALGTGAVAITLSGSAVSDRELAQARELAVAIGIPQVVLAADPIVSAAYRANEKDRCYHCRTVEGSAVRDEAGRRGIRRLLDGIHADDLGDERPGVRAMDEAGFFHPLLWAGWGKEEVRREARARGLPNWDRPSDACLASRVARGTPITPSLLRRVEAAESVLLGRGFRRVRVRVEGDAARIEVDPSELSRLREEELRAEVEARLRSLGFTSVRVDPRGYRGGALALPIVR